MLSFTPGVDALPPGEVLWAYLRCHYAKKILSPAVAEDVLDSIIPGMNVLDWY